MTNYSENWTPEIQREYNRQYMKEWRKRNPKKDKASRVKYRQNNTEARYRASRKWDAKNKEKLNCQKKLQYFVRIGRVQKSDNCSQCGSDYFIEGHHEDYSKPEEVIWLCKFCHNKTWAETEN